MNIMMLDNSIDWWNFLLFFLCCFLLRFVFYIFFLWIFILFVCVVDSNNPLYKGTTIEDFIVLDIQLICS